MFREALKAGWYDLLLARDAYRVAAGEHGLHRDLVSRFLEVCTQMPGWLRVPAMRSHLFA